MNRERTTIESTTSIARYARDVADRREIVAFLAWRDISVRYRQTFLGMAWALFRPVLVALAMGAIFKSVGSGSVAFTYSLSGAIGWLLFASTLQEGANSLQANAAMIGKVYFPRVAFPLGSVGAPLLDACVAVVLLLGAAAVAGAVGPRALAAPLALVALITPAVALGSSAALLTARYRDLRIILPFLLQVGLLATPIGYSTSSLTASLPFLSYINPATYGIDLLRWSVEAGPLPSLAHALCTAGVTVIAGVAGFLGFVRQDARLAEVL